MRVLQEITGEGFRSEVQYFYQGEERVEYLSDLDIDADGANGQNGAKAAYMAGDRGSEYLANGGMEMIGGKVVGHTTWWKDIVLQKGGAPLVLPNGVIPSMTAYRYPDKDPQDPAAYVDSETVEYSCVPPVVIEKTKGAVMGCLCVVIDTFTGLQVETVVADKGPRNKNGEGSIQLARSLQIPSNPRSGGFDGARFRFIIYPGRPAVIRGHRFALQTSRGLYLPA